MTDPRIEAAEKEARRILAEAGVWVAETRPATRLGRWACGPLLPLWDALLGRAKECYCCAFLRGVLYGVALGAVVSAVVVRLA